MDTGPPARAARRVAANAVDHPDYRTRWQAAVLAGEVASWEVVARFVADADEYVRRRALLSARDRFPDRAEAVALQWVEAEHEYSRMVALDTLYAVESDRFEAAARRLERDASLVVRSRVRELHEATSE